MRYYSLWEREGGPEIPDGKEVTPSEILASVRESVPEFINIKDISEYPISNIRGLEKNLASIVYLISGRKPEPNDRKGFLHIISELINKTKKLSNQEKNRVLSKDFLMGCLPYILTGFKLDSKCIVAKDGANNENNFFELLRMVCADDKLDVSSYLCAHRGVRTIDGPDRLLSKLKYEDIRKVVNLVKGVFCNSYSKGIEFSFFQPSGTSKSATYIFPQMIFSHLEDGELADLLLKLNEHSRDLGRFLSNFNDEKISFATNSIDKLVIQANLEATRRFGEKWQTINGGRLYELAGRDYGQALDSIAEIAYFMTQDSVERLMPFYLNPPKLSEETIKKNIKRASDLENNNGEDNLKLEVENIIRSLKSEQNIYGRSIYETLFYYLWGLGVGTKSGISIGLDTDHEMFQTASWELGWKETKNLDYGVEKVGSPLLYARKSKELFNKRNLSDINFRQFWR